MKTDKRWYVPGVAFMLVAILRINQAPYVLREVPEMAVFVPCLVLSLICYMMPPLYPVIKANREEARKWRSIKREITASVRARVSGRDELVILGDTHPVAHTSQLIALHRINNDVQNILWMEYEGDPDAEMIVLARRYVFSKGAGRVIRLHGTWRQSEDPQIPDFPGLDDLRLMPAAYLASEDECRELARAIQTWSVAATHND